MTFYNVLFCFSFLISMNSLADQKNIKNDFAKIFKTVKAEKVYSKGSLLIHSKTIFPLVKAQYSAEDLKRIEKAIQPAVEIKIRNGLVQASDRPLNSKDDPTHYDAIWLRDTLWAYLGLLAQNRTVEAKHVILKMLDYLSSPDQVQRFKNIIKNPSLVTSPDGAMQVVHIRFDGNSPAFKDVQVNGQNQKWNHKQNDALGLFYDLILRAIRDNTIAPSEISSQGYETLVLFPAYFSAIKFYDMEDAGSWEEIEKVASSSVGLVTSSLETLNQLLGEPQNNKKDFTKGLELAAKKLGLEKFLKLDTILKLIDQGYDRISKQINIGESPSYSEKDPRFRKADAAMLNLIYPAQLTRLTTDQKYQILLIVKDLAGDVGIRRYFNDSYQSGNFWLTGDTDDTSTLEKFADRGKKFIEGSEAQWFFDSWYSTCATLIGQSDEGVVFFNRALSQITGDSGLSADGHKVKAFALPESYNTLIFSKERVFAPSPITPLNWAKASLSITLAELKKRK